MRRHIATLAAIGLGSAIVTGCTPNADEPEPILTSNPETFEEDTATLRTVESERGEVDSPVAAMPVAQLGPGEDGIVWMVQSPQLLRVTASAVGTTRDQNIVQEVEAGSGEVMVIDPVDGITLGNQVLLRGPLSDEAVYRLYALPPGGERNEVIRSTLRPSTPGERQRAMNDLAEQRRLEILRRQAEQKDATSQPTGDSPRSPSDN